MRVDHIVLIIQKVLLTNQQLSLKKRKDILNQKTLDIHI